MSDQSSNNPHQTQSKPDPAPEKPVWGTSMERNDGNIRISDRPAPEPSKKSRS